MYYIIICIHTGVCTSSITIDNAIAMYILEKFNYAL